jgi:translation initiation factor IF-2
MDTVSQPKVFEFAKEIGMSPLALMDKIREWKLPVRSHMAELEPEVLEAIKVRLKGDGSSGADASAKKKKPVGKRAAAVPNGAAEPTESSSATSAVAKKPVVRKVAAAAASATTAATVGAVPSQESASASAKKTGVVVKKAPAKVVIRRKSDEEEVESQHDSEDEALAAPTPDVTTSSASVSVSDTAPAVNEPEVISETPARHALASDEIITPKVEVKPEIKPEVKAEVKKSEVKVEAKSEAPERVQKAPPISSIISKPAAPKPVVSKPVAPKPHIPRPAAPSVPVSPTVVSKEVDNKPAAVQTATSTVAPVAAPVVVAAASHNITPVEVAAVTAPSTPGQQDSVPHSSPVPGRKREVVMTAQGPVSGVRSDAPRRNIVGRMDLSRVQPPPSSRPSPGPHHGGPSSGPGPGPGMGGMSGPGRAPGGPGGASVGPRALRTGFVAPAPLISVDEEMDARKRDFEKKARAKTGAGTPGFGGGREREREEEVQQFSETEFRKREMVFQPKKKKSALNREARKTQLTKPKASKRVVKIDQTMKLSDLANEVGVKAGQLTKVLMQNGVVATMNTELDFDTISLIMPEFGWEAQNVHRTVDQMIESHAFGDLKADLIVRSPVVTIMGHVDHGKTSLLDVIRKANVAGGEAGGITQHIGAYQVTTESGHLITFVDTPGHEAFTAMRARGANITDIAVIVVAADDGVMPQTIEAVSHAKAAGVPIIVALNKMDKPGANPDRVKQQLTEQQLVPEEWGGDTIYVPVSAHTKLGIPELLEQLYLVAEVEELRANPERSATGVVIESRMDKGRGPVATLLVQDGTLKVGQSIVVGSISGRVRNLLNDRGERVDQAGPSVPVEILGLPSVPEAGDRFDVTEDDKAAEDIAATRRKKSDEGTAVAGKVSLEDIFAKLKQGDFKELPIILKTDVAGSSEAIKGMFDKVATSEVKIKIVHSAVGGINESDVLLASTAKGIVVGFNVRPDSGAQTAAKRHGVEIKTYSIVYEMMDDLKKAMAGLLTPEIVEKQLGRAEVRNTFNVPKAGTIAGSFVSEGKILRNAEVRLLRDGKIVYTGKLSSLKRFKDDAKEVAQGFECGIGIENYNDLKVGDVIEAFVKESIIREL